MTDGRTVVQVYCVRAAIDLLLVQYLYLILLVNYGVCVCERRAGCLLGSLVRPDMYTILYLLVWSARRRTFPPPPRHLASTQ